MADATRTRDELERELETLKSRIAELERAGEGHRHTEKGPKGNQDDLRREQDKAQSYFNIANAMLMVLNERGEVTLINQKGCDVLGYTRDEIIGVNWFDHFLPAAIRENVSKVFRKLMAGDLEPAEHYENPVLTRNGQERLLSWHNTYLRNANGRITDVLTSGQDITEHRQAEEALRKSEVRYRRLVQTLQEGIWAMDSQGLTTFVNAPMARMLGYQVEEMLGRHLFSFMADESIELGKKKLASRQQGASEQHDFTFLRKDGTRIDTLLQTAPMMDEAGHYAGAIAGVLDITERKQIEQHRSRLEELVERRTRQLRGSQEQLQRAQRLASIGTFAAGIAHEINNPLGTMLLGTDAALGCLDQPEALEKLLRQNKRDVERCARVVKAVLDFARQWTTEKQPLDLNEVVRHSIDFARDYATQRGVTLEPRLEHGLDLILGNSTELEQVATNPVHNAIQACEKGGCIIIETGAMGDRVRLVVRDNGRGMTPEQVDHAFDPFYTTRLEKGGTGLGLSTVHGIVTAHGGTVDIASEKGKGTVLTVEFPKA